MATNITKLPYMHFERVYDFFSSSPYLASGYEVYRSGELFYINGSTRGSIGSGWVVCATVDTSKVRRYHSENTGTGFNFTAMIIVEDVVS